MKKLSKPLQTVISQETHHADTYAYARHGADGLKGEVRSGGVGHPLATDVAIAPRRVRGTDCKSGDDRSVYAQGHDLNQQLKIVAHRGHGNEDGLIHNRQEDRRADRDQT